MDWSKYAPYFTEQEFKCKHTGKCEMHPDFMDFIFDVRKAYGKPLVITSGYRDTTHPIEAKKTKRGEHTYGLAADFAVQGRDALELVALAYLNGCRRIGVQQKGAGRFIHLGWGDKLAGFSQAMWSY